MKIGDKVIVARKINIGVPQISNGTIVEIVGFANPMPGTLLSGTLQVCRDKNGLCMAFYPEDLNPLPVSLTEGQECWVKMNFYSKDIEGDIILNYRDYENDKRSITVKPTHEILIKNAEGQIVPYAGE